MSPEQALQELLDGNLRFRTGQSHAWEYRPEDLLELSKAQKPLAAVIACSDSRCAPEIVFDQPLGTIFACRVPGNVASESSTWVVDMAVSEFKVPLVVVMGHTGCLAVSRVLQGGGWGLSGMLRMELQAGLSEFRSTDLMANPVLAIEANSKHACGQLKRATPSLEQAVNSGKTHLMAAVYEMETGNVRVLE
ncbi:MAG: hypothetical protein HZC36_12685 [Armatimonadetes bacterium]|nr:hypothetical protein [Armatimonadota bacterium]